MTRDGQTSRSQTFSPLLGALAIGIVLAWVGLRALGNIAVSIPWMGSPGTTAVVPEARAGESSGSGARDTTPRPAPRVADHGNVSVDSASSPFASGGPSTVGVADLEVLRSKRLSIPVRGVSPETITSNFHQARGTAEHEALDVLAPRGQPVVAVEDGTIAKLFFSQRGGKTIYQFDPTGTYAYYYAHLDRYADGLAEGTAVRRGEVIGYVGTSGNAPANTPHLHFAIFKLGPERQWWKGTAIDPSAVLR